MTFSHNRNKIIKTFGKLKKGTRFLQFFSLFTSMADLFFCHNKYVVILTKQLTSDVSRVHLCDYWEN